MKNPRSVIISIFVMLSLTMMFAPHASAATTVPDPPMPEVALVDLSPGGIINFNGSMRTPVGDIPDSGQVRIDAGGSFAYSAVLIPAEGATVPFSIPISTDVIIANCIVGSFTFTYWLTSYPGSDVSITLPCSVLADVPPAPVVTPVLPTVQTDVCGPSNDIITIPAQPAGIVTHEPGWISGNQEIYFSVEPGYVIAGTTFANFTDAATPCPTETPTEVPTEIPTEVPTEIPTEVPAEVPADVPPLESTAEPSAPPAATAEPPPLAGPVAQQPSASRAPAVVTSLPSTGSGHASDHQAIVGFTSVIVAAIALGVICRHPVARKRS